MKEKKKDEEEEDEEEEEGIMGRVTQSRDIQYTVLIRTRI